jgi:ADP-ribosylglycohydrolase
MPGLTYRGPVAEFVKDSLERALRENWTALQAGETWGSGAYLLETMPTALYILARHAGDPQEALVRAVNDTKDSDGIAALVGAAVGALHGKDALPGRWVAGLLGRTGDHNDGHVFRLIDEARMRFG